MISVYGLLADNSISLVMRCWFLFSPVLYEVDVVRFRSIGDIVCNCKHEYFWFISRDLLPEKWSDVGMRILKRNNV